MDDKAKKNTLKINKEATEWSKKIHILYEKLLNGSEVSKAQFFHFGINSRFVSCCHRTTTGKPSWMQSDSMVQTSEDYQIV